MEAALEISRHFAMSDETTTCYRMPIFRGEEVRMHVPLTILSEDEQLFRDACRSFAEERIRPLVRKMDEEAKLEPSIIPELFDSG